MNVRLQMSPRLTWDLKSQVGLKFGMTLMLFEEERSSTIWGFTDMTDIYPTINSEMGNHII